MHLLIFPSVTRRQGITTLGGSLVRRWLPWDGWMRSGSLNIPSQGKSVCVPGAAQPGTFFRSWSSPAPSYPCVPSGRGMHSLSSVLGHCSWSSLGGWFICEGVSGSRARLCGCRRYRMLLTSVLIKCSVLVRCGRLGGIATTTESWQSWSPIVGWRVLAYEVRQWHWLPPLCGSPRLRGGRLRRARWRWRPQRRYGSHSACEDVFLNECRAEIPSDATWGFNVHRDGAQE